MFGSRDEDIIARNTLKPTSSMSYKSSPTSTSSSVRFQPIAMHQKQRYLPHVGIQIRHSLMHWKLDDDKFHLVLFLPLEGLWIMLCDHGKVLHHLFGPSWTLYRLVPSAQVVGTPSFPPNPSLLLLFHKRGSHRRLVLILFRFRFLKWTKHWSF